MDIEKLIETLRQHGVSCVRAYGKYCSICDEAATALSTLQAEIKRLYKIVCSIPTTPDSGRTVSQYDKEMSICAYLDDLEAENEKLRAELEQMAACVYYKAGGLCRYGGDDPANICVLGPCPNERTVQEVLAELEQVKRENDALWTYIEIVDREYRRYMDRGYIDRLDELKRTWRRGQKEN